MMIAALPVVRLRGGAASKKIIQADVFFMKNGLKTNFSYEILQKFVRFVSKSTETNYPENSVNL